MATTITTVLPAIVTADEVKALQSQHIELVVEDYIDLAIDELFDIEFPAKKDTKTPKEVSVYAETLTNSDAPNWGVWVHYPWLNKVVHMPPKAQLRALRTSRNRNLITSEEQAKLYDATLLIIGMSVGSNIVEALVSQGIGGKLVLVDMDIIEPSNLNRIRSPYHHVGLHKVDAIARKVWEIDPFIEIVGYYDGLNETNLYEILDTQNVNIIVDEMDELRMKVILREAASKHRLPVLMAADDGDDALIDVERYDLTPDLTPFDGRIPAELLERIKSEKIPRAELGVMIGRYFVGAENIPLRMYQSLMEVGKTLPSWPQLGGAAALSGISIAFLAKKIILGLSVQTGRTLVSLDEKLNTEPVSESDAAQLKKFQAMTSGN